MVSEAYVGPLVLEMVLLLDSPPESTALTGIHAESLFLLDNI